MSLYPSHTSHSSSSPSSSSQPAANRQMGQGPSRPPPVQDVIIPRSLGPGQKLKRAFAGRRKKSEDASMFARSQDGAPVDVPPLHLSQNVVQPPVASPPHSLRTARSPPPLSSPPADASRPSIPSSVRPVPRTAQTPSPPPPLPEKDGKIKPSSLDVLAVAPAGSRNSVIPLSPGITSAVNYMLEQNAGKDGGGDKLPQKESWRKSDSNDSHHTVRQGNNTSRTSRPVSWAESFQSAHTVVQGSGSNSNSNKRRSALIGDADFGMPEEDGDEDYPAPTRRASPSPASSIKLRNRRSMSLSAAVPSKSAPHPAITSPSSHSVTSDHALSPNNRPRAPSLSPSLSQPQIVSPPAVTSAGSSKSNRTPAWSPQMEPNFPSLPAEQRERDRQPHVTGIAAGFAKKAMEKSKKWGMGLGMGVMGIAASHSGSGSGYSSSSSSTNAASSYTSGDYGLTRTSSGGSGGQGGLMHSFLPKSSSNQGYGGHGQNHKRTPNAQGAAGSISSSINSSDTDPFAGPVAPVVGQMLRGPLRQKGCVFGQQLKVSARETGVNVGKTQPQPKKEGLVGELEERMVPALVVRCAQHVLIWGVEEEGLFRVSGRPAHVNKIRSEFDSGADYDMTDCNPGDLDPHAVSSVFKAYLRELPEPILTKELQPYFDAAVYKESAMNDAQAPTAAPLSIKPGQGLPSGPKGGFQMRKPPSLSTLAMPSFHGLPPPSKQLISTIRTLITQLPQENRDLIKTVVDLIKATAKKSKETKMPISNLMLVFCPSLNMAPPLLKVLCEAEGIWLDEEEVIEIKNTKPRQLQSKASDLQLEKDLPSSPRVKDRECEREKEKEQDTSSDIADDERSDARSGTTEDYSVHSGRMSLDGPSSDYHASAEDNLSSYEENVDAVPTRRSREKTERPDVPTVYLDTRSHLSSSSSSLLQDPPETSKYTGSFSHHSRDAAADDGSISSVPYSYSNSMGHNASPPAFSSSVESVVTPTSSANPSFSNLPIDGAGQNKKDVVGDGTGHPQVYHHQPQNSIEQGQVLEFGTPALVTPAPLKFGRRTNTGDKAKDKKSDAPVQFPTTTNHGSTSTPVSVKRRSIPLLSLSSFSPYGGIAGSDSSSSPHSSEASSASPHGSEKSLRSKKPSLKLLFSKKSSSSLSSSEKNRDQRNSTFLTPPSSYNGKLAAQQQSERSFSSGSTGTSDSYSSISTPHSAVTAMSSVAGLPPVLDTPIEGGGFDLGFGGVEGVDGPVPATATIESVRAEFKTPTVAAQFTPAAPPMPVPVTAPPMPSAAQPVSTAAPPAQVPIAAPTLSSSPTTLKQQQPAPPPAPPMNVILPVIAPLSIASRAKKSIDSQNQAAANRHQQPQGPRVRPSASFSSLSGSSSASHSSKANANGNANAKERGLTLLPERVGEQEAQDDWAQSVLQAAAVSSA